MPPNGNVPFPGSALTLKRSLRNRSRSALTGGSVRQFSLVSRCQYSFQLRIPSGGSFDASAMDVSLLGRITDQGQQLVQGCWPIGERWDYQVGTGCLKPGLGVLASCDRRRADSVVPTGLDIEWRVPHDNDPLVRYVVAGGAGDVADSDRNEIATLK